MSESYTLRLRPSVEELEQVVETECQGRFEVGIYASTSIGEVIDVLQIKLKTDASFSFTHNKRHVSSMESVFSTAFSEAVLEYSRVPSRLKCDKGVQINGRKRRRKSYKRQESFPPSGVSRFKYLRVRQLVL